MKRKMIKVLLLSVCFFITAYSVTGAQGSYSENLYEKTETVYAVLDYNGQVLDERVVNRLYAPGETDTISDFGDYLDLSHMEAEVRPQISGSRITWGKEALKDGSLYYEGTTNKALPVDVKIDYYLDGKKTEAQDLVGKSGNLKVAIKIENRLKTLESVTYESLEKGPATEETEMYVPLLAQVSWELDLDTFPSVKAENAVSTVTGKTMNLGFSLFPYPRAEAVLEMTGKNIELNPITITIVPMLPPVPGIDMEEDLVKLLSGIKKMGDAITRVREGIDSAQKKMGSGDQIELVFKGADELTRGYEKLDSGLNELIVGFDSSLSALTKLKDGLGQLNSRFNEKAPGLDQMLQYTETVTSSAQSLGEGAQDIALAGSQMVSGVNELKKINDGILEQARALIAINPEGSPLHSLGMAIIQQNNILQALAPAGEQIVASASEMDKAAQSLKDAMEKGIAPGMANLSSSLSELGSGLQAMYGAMEELEAGQKKLKEGLYSYRDGTLKLSSAMKTLTEKAGDMKKGLSEFSRGQKMIADALGTIESDAILKMEEELSKAVDEIRFGKAQMDRMKSLAQGYRSFMDNGRNKNSKVQFILKTKEVKVEKPAETGSTAAKTEKKSFWDKLLSLFGLR